MNSWHNGIKNADFPKLLGIDDIKAMKDFIWKSVDEYEKWSIWEKVKFLFFQSPNFRIKNYHIEYVLYDNCLYGSLLNIYYIDVYWYY